MGEIWGSSMETIYQAWRRKSLKHTSPILKLFIVIIPLPLFPQKVWLVPSRTWRSLGSSLHSVPHPRQILSRLNQYFLLLLALNPCTLLGSHRDAPCLLPGLCLGIGGISVCTPGSPPRGTMSLNYRMMVQESDSEAPFRPSLHPAAS